MRRTQPITQNAKISSTTHVHCYNGYMVRNNNNTKSGLLPQTLHNHYLDEGGELQRLGDPVGGGPQLLEMGLEHLPVLGILTLLGLLSVRFPEHCYCVCERGRERKRRRMRQRKRQREGNR